MKKLILSLAVFFGTCQVASALEETSQSRVPTPLTSYQYNDFAQNFRERSTSVFVEGWSNGSFTVSIIRNDYGRDYSIVSFDRAGAIQALGYIAQYERMADELLANSGLATEAFGRTQPFDEASVEVGIHSGNTERHYLTLSFCLRDCSTDRALYFIGDQVTELKRLLETFVELTAS